MSSADLNNKLNEYGLTAEEDIKCNLAFEIFDKDGSGYIDAAELRRVLEMMGQPQTEQAIYHMIKQASPSQDRTITLDQFKQVIGEQKKVQHQVLEEDTMDAFVSMGGEQDGSGHVNA